MSTNSQIGIENADGKIRSVYVHWDGHPRYLGKMLVEHYHDRERAEQLIELGSLSSVHERLAPKVDEYHTFYKPAKKVTVAFHRDRDEDLHINTHINKKSYVKSAHEYKYTYLLTNDNEWLILQRESTEAGFTPIPENY